MLKIKNYVKVNSIEEAYELNQKRTAIVLGGMIWLKMGSRTVSTAIDLSGLGLNQIIETEDSFEIGCMTSLHDLECSEALNDFTQGAIRESVRHIVGVQFRNCATVGGSIWGRYGFSDVLTMFLALGAEVNLYPTGRMPLPEFINRKKDNDILVSVRIPKQELKAVYLSQRNTETDFPVLTCAACLRDGQPYTAIGARPGRAMLIEDPNEILASFLSKDREERMEAAERFSVYAAEQVKVGGNMRGSEEYRKLLAEVLTKRAWNILGDHSICR